MNIVALGIATTQKIEEKEKQEKKWIGSDSVGDKHGGYGDDLFESATDMHTICLKRLPFTLKKHPKE